MNTRFRYDYNFKMLAINIVLTSLFFIIFAISYDKGVIAFCLFGLASIFSLFNTVFFIYNQGITIRSKDIIIIDYFWLTKINFDDLKWVELKEIRKEKNTNLYGFFNEFYHYTTYMYKSDYIYNNGKVFKIIFHLKNGSAKETYFGWMYKEKSKLKVKKVQEKLEIFVREINNKLKIRESN